MNILQICPPHVSYVATLSLEISKSHFSALSLMYFRLFMLSQKKTNRNCCTAALAVYLLLFSASYYLHSPSTASGHITGGARVYDSCLLIRTCWGLRQQLVTTWAEFQHSVVYYATDQCRKILEACINACSRWSLQWRPYRWCKWCGAPGPTTLGAHQRGPDSNFLEN